MRILSGIQPSGVLHIGNYFGMMRPAIELQARGRGVLFHRRLPCADECARSRRAARKHAATWRSIFSPAGSIPERAVFFRQSDVPEVTELAWMLSTVTPMGLLERAHSYKDKIARGLAASVGLFAYPVLMAADILIYDSDVVPVGRDQKQHVEVTRDIAIKFNETYGEILKLPEPRIRDAKTATVPGLDGQKMSKSYGNTIEIFGEEKEMRKRVMSIVTDSTPVEAPKDPAASTDLSSSSRSLARRRKWRRCAPLSRKAAPATVISRNNFSAELWEFFAPMRKRREEILAQPGYIDEVLAKGAARANAIANEVMARVRSAVGLR